MWDEARIVVERLNCQHATTAMLLQAAVSAVLSEEAGREFRSVIENLIEA